MSSHGSSSVLGSGTSPIMQWFIIKIPHFTGAISILGSMAVISTIFESKQSREKLKRPYHRFMLMITLFDFIFAAAVMLSSLPSPTPVQSHTASEEDTPSQDESQDEQQQQEDQSLYVPGARGNQSSCTAQAFVMQLGLAVPLYVASLCIFLFLTLQRNIRRDVFAAKIEPYLHLTSILFPLSTAIASHALGIYGTNGSVIFCTIDQSFILPYGALFGGLILLFSTLVVVLTMSSVYAFIHRKEKTVQRYGIHGEHSSRYASLANQKKDLRINAMLIFVAFFFTYIWSFLLISTTRKDGSLLSDDGRNILLIFQSIFLPLHGLWNFFFYITRSNLQTLSFRSKMRRLFFFLKWCNSDSNRRSNNDNNNNEGGSEVSAHRSIISFLEAGSNLSETFPMTTGNGTTFYDAELSRYLSSTSSPTAVGNTYNGNGNMLNISCVPFEESDAEVGNRSGLDSSTSSPLSIRSRSRTDTGDGDNISLDEGIVLSDHHYDRDRPPMQSPHQSPIHHHHHHHEQDYLKDIMMNRKIPTPHNENVATSSNGSYIGSSRNLSSSDGDIDSDRVGGSQRGPGSSIDGGSSSAGSSKPMSAPKGDGGRREDVHLVGFTVGRVDRPPSQSVSSVFE